MRPGPQTPRTPITSHLRPTRSPRSIREADAAFKGRGARRARGRLPLRRESLRRDLPGRWAVLPGSPQADSRRTIRLSRVGSGRDDAWPFRLIGFDRSVLIDAPNRHTAVGKATNVGPGASNDAAKPAIDSSGVWLVPASSQARESTPSLLSDPRSADFPKLPVQPLCVGADQLLGSARRAMRRNGKGEICLMNHSISRRGR